MALVSCPECGREKVSDTAESCPNCGYAIKAHYIKISQEKACKERRLIAELEKKRTEEEKERKEQEEYNSIKMPRKPQIQWARPVVMWAITIFLFVLTNIAVGVIFAIVAIRDTGYTVYVYNQQMQKYKFAQEDFEGYKKDCITRWRQIRENELEEKKRRELDRSMQEHIAKSTGRVCPLCGSIDVYDISTVERAASVVIVGLASGKIGKQYKCQKCKHMW